jgi:tetratricopeptide (TPR) repeat protein
MAAPSQTSPSHASEKDAAASVKPAPEEVETTLKTAPIDELTYESTESSDAYLLAKSLLNDGDFDNAMETIGTAMGIITSQLPPDMAAVHEALAPLYYLYGTTLLYSMEESDDSLQAPTTAEDEADDSQIAWENLETARIILESMKETTKLTEKRQLDLAQIHLRLGDLQRTNGRYPEAVQDYMTCLEIRVPLLGHYHRKVADTHYNLGLLFMLLASEGDKQQQQKTPDSTSAAAAAAPTGDEDPQQPLISPELREEYRHKALTHYLAGGKSFAGQIAFLCGTSPEEITADGDPSGTEAAGGKTTGMDEAELRATAMSATLKAIRARVAKLHAPAGDDGESTIHDLKEILDEIQETMDEADSAKQAIGEVSEMKVQAQAAAEGDGEVVNALDGSTTTIGFAAPSAAVVPAAAQPTMMVARKKKKRDPEAKDSKMSATSAEDDSAAKRQKTVE